MAYDSVKTSKLNSALNKAELDTKKLKDLKSSFNANKWNSVARKKVEKAIDDLISLYNDLNKKVDGARDIKDKIKKYKIYKMIINHTHTGLITIKKGGLMMMVHLMNMLLRKLGIIKIK